MAQERATDQEPSIEEILDYIRQIIADDAPAPEPTPAYVPDPIPEEPVFGAVPQDEVIELNIPVMPPDPPKEPVREVELQDGFSEKEDDFSSPEPSAHVEQMASIESILSGGAAPNAPTYPPEEEGESMAYSGNSVSEPASSIMTDRAASAAIEALSTLAARAAVERSGGVTLEDIVRDEMRPILRAWLDRNLPPLIERLMKQELERLSKSL